jgi:hypothetical protein
VIADNAGGDEFTALSPRPIASNQGWWTSRGFSVAIIPTTFSFASVEEARTLISFYFGAEVGQTIQKREIEYKVVAHSLTT